MNRFLASNKWQFRLLRTVFQAIVGFIVANIDIIVGTFNLDGSVKALIVGVVMCVLAPVMKALGMEDEKVRDEYARPIREADDDAE